jgi:hypothetical protein
LAKAAALNIERASLVLLIAFGYPLVKILLKTFARLRSILEYINKNYAILITI